MPKPKPAPPSVLILAAWPPEIAPLIASLRSRRSASPSPRTSGERVGVRGIAVSAAVCRVVGTGPVEAAIGAARAIADTRPRAVIFVGTAGAYASARRRFAVGTAASARDLRLVSTATLRGDGFLPQPLPTHTLCDEALRKALRKAGAVGSAGVACPLAITRTHPLGRRIATATRADLENLEAFAIARAAAAAGVPFAAVLGVANRVGPAAHAEWLAHHAAASRAACAVVLAWLRAPSRR